MITGIVVALLLAVIVFQYMIIKIDKDKRHEAGWKTSLPVVLFGMLGIFIVIGVVVLVTYLLNKLTSTKKKKDKDEK